MKKILLLSLLFSCFVSFGQYTNNSAPTILTGTGTVWDDVVTTGLATRINPATSLPAFSYDSLAILFVRDADSSEILYYQIQMPHRIKVGSSGVMCSPHFHYSQYAAADTTFTPALWYRLHDIGGRSGRWTRIIPTTRSVLTYTGTMFHNICEFPDITLTNINESSFIEFKLYRYDGAGNPATLYMKGFDVHFEISKLGTLDEYPTIY